MNSECKLVAPMRLLVGTLLAVLLSFSTQVSFGNPYSDPDQMTLGKVSSLNGSGRIDEIIKLDQKYWKIDPRRGQALVKAEPKSLDDVQKLVEAAQNKEQKEAICKNGLPLCKNSEDFFQLVRIVPAGSSTQAYIFRMCAKALKAETMEKLMVKYGDSFIDPAPKNPILADFEKKYSILLQLSGDLEHARLSRGLEEFEEAVLEHNSAAREKAGGNRVIGYDEFVGQKPGGKSPPMVQSSENPKRNDASVSEERRKKRQIEQREAQEKEDRRRAEEYRRIQNNLLGVPTY